MSLMRINSNLKIKASICIHSEHRPQISRMKFLQVALSVEALFLSLGSALPANEPMEPKPSAQTRMQKITSMYGFEGFVYALDVSV